MRTATILLYRISTNKAPPDIVALEELYQVLLIQTDSRMLGLSTSSAGVTLAFQAENTIVLHSSSTESPQTQTPDEGIALRITAEEWVDGVPLDKLALITFTLVFIGARAGANEVDRNSLLAASINIGLFACDVPAHYTKLACDDKISTVCTCTYSESR